MIFWIIHQTLDTDVETSDPGSKCMTRTILSLKGNGIYIWKEMNMQQNRHRSVCTHKKLRHQHLLHIYSLAAHVTLNWNALFVHSTRKIVYKSIKEHANWRNELSSCKLNSFVSFTEISHSQRKFNKWCMPESNCHRRTLFKIFLHKYKVY